MSTPALVPSGQCSNFALLTYWPVENVSFRLGDDILPTATAVLLCHECDSLPRSLFLHRLQEDAARRQASLESQSAAVYQDLTFRPTLSAASERFVGDSAWAGAITVSKRRVEQRENSQPSL